MELRIEFDDRDSWSAWANAHAHEANTWRQRILSSITNFGIVEPFCGIRIPAGALVVNPTNYRESLSYNGLNSRKRALLLEFDLLRRQFPRFAARNARVFSPEALSRTALLLRGTYPYYLGTEYMPNPEKQRTFYPIQHADLTRLAMPDETFDAVLTGDVLEHVPDLYRSLQELSRVIRPGGALLSTFPFAGHSAETIIAAKLQGDQIVYLQPPSYHGDPLDPNGVLVFQIPGWDILEMCYSLGFGNARMVMHASSEHGIVADATIGVFVLSAIKSNGSAKRPARSWIWNADRINRVIGVLGLPRSGTTMFTAVLDAHDDVTSIYEPWNAHKKALADGTKTITAESLTAEAEAQSTAARTMVVKETTANFAHAKYLTQILDQVLPPLSQHMVILLRNPFHCFLSEIEGRRKWWGEASLQMTQDVFTNWAQRTLGSLAQLIEVGERYKCTFVFYEACVSEPGPTFTAVMREVGLDFRAAQLAITKNSDLSKVRGDRSLVENARDVGDLSVAKRSAEFDIAQSVFSDSPLFTAISGVSDLFTGFVSRGTISVTDPDRGEFLAAVKSLTATTTV